MMMIMVGRMLGELRIDEGKQKEKEMVEKSKLPNPKKKLNGFLCVGAPPFKRHRYAPRCSSDPVVFLRINTFLGR
jgi:hypothetical protein